MARQAGIEPTTPWFVARYSIQLSYWRATEALLYRIIFLCQFPFRAIAWNFHFFSKNYLDSYDCNKA